MHTHMKFEIYSINYTALDFGFSLQQSFLSKNLKIGLLITAMKLNHC